MIRYRWRPVEPHDLYISKGVATNDTTWFWLCRTHGHGSGRPLCAAHMTEFMRVAIHRDRQERLL